MSRTVQRRIIAGFCVAATVVLVVAYFTYRVVGRSIEAERWTAHTGIVLANLTQLSNLFTEADIAARYLAMDGGEGSLEALAESRNRVNLQLTRLGEITRDNPRQQHNLGNVEEMVQRRFHFLDEMIAIRQSKGLDAAMAYWRERRGLRILSDAELSIKAAEIEETNLLNDRVEESQKVMKLTAAVILFLTLAVVLLLIGLLVFIVRHLRWRATVMIHLTRAKIALENQVEELQGRVLTDSERQALHNLQGLQTIVQRAESFLATNAETV